jgi:osmotically-inducible protein OsmY
MRTDTEVQNDVMEELKWEATINSIKATDIGVACRSGIVTLTGVVDSYSKKLAAEKATMRVAGVKAVANDIEVKLWSGFKKNDTDIAETILNAIKWSTSIPEEKVKVKVDEGWVTLEGDVEWEFQRYACKNAVEDLRGVRGVTNNIKVIATEPAINEIKEMIRSAIRRNAVMDANKIEVDISGTQVILKGEVRSLAEKNDAEEAAWSARGITQVDNRLEVNYSMVFA